jgi:hypothetical protein
MQPLDMPLVGMGKKLREERPHFLMVVLTQSLEDLLKEGMLFGWIDVAGEEVLEELSDFLVRLGFELDG